MLRYLIHLIKLKINTLHSSICQYSGSGDGSPRLRMINDKGKPQSQGVGLTAAHWEWVEQGQAVIRR